MQESWAGRTIGGCTIRRELSRGGMSVIYLADQVSVGRPVAVKVLSSSLLGDPTFMTRFTAEVTTTASLQHPHIEPVFDFGREGDVPFIVMAYQPGGTVADLIAAGPLPLALAVQIVEQVADALDYAHARGVIHRDVKPDNILLDGEQNAVLADFGVSKVLAGTQALTGGDVVGTPSYLAPELIAGSAPPSPASDIYALGVTLYQMLSGELPFRADSAVETLWAHVNTPPPGLRAGRPDIPPAVEEVLQRALAKAPADRFSSAGEMAAALSDAAGAGQPHAVSAPAPQAQRVEATVQRVLDQVVKITRGGARPGVGSGIYLPGDQVLTCLHVVDGAPGLTIRFRSGEQMAASVLATDPATDLALLALERTPQSIEASRLDAISFDFAPLEPGAPVVAIGHPFDLEWAVTGGHFNGLRQPHDPSLERFGVVLNAPLVQVDVAINPGNSGGPLIDMAGRLVGLADSVISPALAANIGFGIEAQTAHRFWQAHTADDLTLVACSCGHHHPPGTAYCPLTGKPSAPLPAVEVEPAGSVPYSCGHQHPPGLDYCPLLGKPIQPMSEPVQAGEDLTQLVSACTNCGFSYPVGAAKCPSCGKPRRP